MKHLVLSLGVALACMSLAAATPHPAKAADNVEKFDLATLADGETRNFGEGDSTITATRKGSEVTITYGDENGEKKTLRCTIGKDSCTAVTVSDSGKTQMVVLDQAGKSGGDARHVIVSDGEATGRKIMVLTSDDSDAGQVIVNAGDDASWVSDSGDAAAHVKVVHLGEDGSTLLRCPQGDATLTLKKGEENSGPYFCPKHNIQMEKSKDPIIIKKIEVQKKPKDGSNDGEY